MITYPGITVFLNEQIISPDGEQIIVNAVHLLLHDPTTGDVLGEAIFASSQCSVHFAAPPSPPGVLEICKKADNSNGAVTGNYTFTFADRSVTIPVGTCTGPLTVPSGELTVTEVAKTGSSDLSVGRVLGVA